MKLRPSALALTVALALVAFAPAGCRKGAASRQQVLNVYIWSEYLPQGVIDDFTKRTGIKVNVDNYEDNEELLAKLASGVADYDLVVPSDYAVRAMIERKLIRPLDRAKLTNFTNLDAQFLDKPFDPGNKYSVPYFWGITGLDYVKQKVSGPVESWDVLFDERYKGGILMLDDARECFAVALKRLGKSLNETDPKVLAEAGDMLKQQHALVKKYSSGDFTTDIASGEVVLAHGYNGQLAKLVMEYPDRIAFVMPKEGGTFSIDNMAIPAKAGNPAAAHAFINYVLEAQTAARIANEIGYPSPNAAAKAHIKPELLNNPAVYPPKEVLDRCEMMKDIGPAMDTVTSLWTDVKQH
jgi:spermidine/putrescine-binding protein